MCLSSYWSWVQFPLGALVNVVVEGALYVFGIERWVSLRGGANKHIYIFYAADAMIPQVKNPQAMVL